MGLWDFGDWLWNKWNVQKWISCRSMVWILWRVLQKWWVFNKHPRHHHPPPQGQRPGATYWEATNPELVVHQHLELELSVWLVVNLPLRKIWKSMGRMTSHIWWKIKNVWNQQPAVYFTHPLGICYMWSILNPFFMIKKKHWFSHFHTTQKNGWWTT